MWLKDIHCISFRNFTHLELSLSPSINAIIGGNGQGKTNILEGIFCLFTGSSFRTSDDSNLVQLEQDSFYLGGELEQQDRLLKLEVSFGKEAGKSRKVNGQRNSVILKNGPLGIAVFSSYDLRLVQDGPFYRRSFLDDTCALCIPGFTFLRSSYYRVLAHRNALLMSAGKNHSSAFDTSMEVWNEQYVEIGSKLIMSRLQILAELARHLGAIIQDVTTEVREMELVYKCSFLSGLSSPVKCSEVATTFRQKLEACRTEESERGTSLIGPHRDEFRILVNQVDQRFYGSHGQQKAIAVALKLARVMLMRAKLSSWPVVLLDDLFSDFDRCRQERLVSVLANQGQLFVTVQDSSQLPHALKSKARLFTVEHGQVSV